MSNVIPEVAATSAATKLWNPAKRARGSGAAVATMHSRSEVSPALVFRSIIYMAIYAVASLVSVPRTEAAPPTANSVAKVPETKPDSLPEARAGQTERADLARRNAILEAKAQIEEAANSRLENYLGAFGILITVVVLAFGLSAKEAAVAAARRGVEDETQALRNLLTTAESLLRDIQRHAADAEAIKNRMMERGPTPAADAKQSERATEPLAVPAMKDGEPRTTETPAAEQLLRTVEQYEEDVRAANDAGDWGVALSLAKDMRRHYRKNFEIAMSLFQEAFALNGLGEHERSLRTYKKVINRLKLDHSRKARLLLARSLFNSGLVDGRLGEPDKEIASYDEVIRTFERESDNDFRNIVAMSLVNKAVEVGKKGRINEAVSINRRVIDTYGDIEDDRLKKQVAMARRYNNARV